METWIVYASLYVFPNGANIAQPNFWTFQSFGPRLKVQKSDKIHQIPTCSPLFVLNVP